LGKYLFKYILFFNIINFLLLYRIPNDDNIVKVTELIKNREILNSFSLIFLLCEKKSLIKDLDININGNLDNNTTNNNNILNKSCVHTHVYMSSYNEVLAASLSVVAPVINLGLPIGDIGKQTNPLSIGLDRESMYLNNDICQFQDEINKNPKILIGGLGSGGLQSFLLLQHSCVEIITIEVNVDIYYTAINEIGFDSVCHTNLNDDINNNNNNNNNESLNDKCRSSIVFADIWDYIIVTSDEMNNNLNTANYIYDVIVLDIYNSSTHFWDGATGEGQSSGNAIRGMASKTLLALISLIHPIHGVVFFHLHE
jgi:hypothetical protein